MTNQIILPQEEWLRVLKKGMVTIPKAWRLDFGFEEGSFIKAKKTADKITIEPTEKKVPYRIYSQNELLGFIKNDRLTSKEKVKYNRLFASPK